MVIISVILNLYLLILFCYWYLTLRHFFLFCRMESLSIFSIVWTVAEAVCLWKTFLITRPTLQYPSLLPWMEVILVTQFLLCIFPPPGQKASSTVMLTTAVLELAAPLWPTTGQYVRPQSPTRPQTRLAVWSVRHKKKI